MVKERTKRLFCRSLGILGRSGVLDSWRDSIIWKLTPYLLDPKVIPPTITVVRLRGTDVPVLCDARNPFHRSAFWFGALHESGIEVFLRRTLRPGDTVVDVGANYGHISMLAAGLVGPSGVVHAVEPHPHLSERLRQHVETHGFGQVIVHPVALGDRDAELHLWVNPDHLGASTICEGADLHRFPATAPLQKHRVRVVRGDDLLSILPTGQVVVKMDVEGYEPAVLRGMMCLLKERASAAVVEVTPQWIGGPAGVREMFALMKELGYHACAIDCTPTHRSVYKRCSETDIVSQQNVLFLKAPYAAKPEADRL